MIDLTKPCEIGTAAIYEGAVYYCNAVSTWRIVGTDQSTCSGISEDSFAIGVAFGCILMVLLRGAYSIKTEGRRRSNG